MTSVGAKGHKKPGSYLFALAVLAICGFAAYWAVTTLFPTELHQTGRWLHAKYEALRR
jgi:hypothetical protein